MVALVNGLWRQGPAWGGQIGGAQLWLQRIRVALPLVPTYAELRTEPHGAAFPGHGPHRIDARDLLRTYYLSLFP
jgi:hypothetical protein